jgi:penicillin-binding protein 2
MYSSRIKIIIGISLLLVFIPVVRLCQMQLSSREAVWAKIEKLRGQGYSQQFKTLRGDILDRHGKVIATEEGKFKMYMTYELSQFRDSRVQDALRQNALRMASKVEDRDKKRKIIEDTEETIEQAIGDLKRLVDKCRQFGIRGEPIINRIRINNNRIWNARLHYAWRTRGHPSPFYQANRHHLGDVNLPDARTDFEENTPDSSERRRLINAVDITDMYEPWPVLEFAPDQDILAAQLGFLDIDHVTVRPEAVRRYPYRQTASQTIGWIGPPQERDRKLFEKDHYRNYLDDEISGREDGIEYLCEPILRGSRGDAKYDPNGNPIEYTEARFGQNVHLTLDIELQEEVEHFLLNYNHRECCEPNMSVVILDVNSNTTDILALVSLPTFDMTRVRYDYTQLNNHPHEPRINRAIYGHYPPGSVIKPLIAIAGLEEGVITAQECISCPSQTPSAGWPKCWIYKDYLSCHDDKWPNNDTRNAIRGSCNIYFSHLAHRLEPRVLQEWLYKFGYGRQVPLAPPGPIKDSGRRLRQGSGYISSRPKKNTTITSFEQINPLNKGTHRIQAGIGQGELRVTPLQVANSMAIIARDGIEIKPRLFLNETHAPGKPLGISPATLRIVTEGMHAVVHEKDGTAQEAFQSSNFANPEIGVTVYGKTGSTQNPENAWFAGYAKDFSGKCIALSVIVEGGQSGSQDASPLACKIFKFCIDRGYIGHATVSD